MAVLNQLTPAPSSLSSLIGILYAEDFDDVPDERGQAESDPDAVELPPPLTQDDLDRACDAAVLAARLEWQNDVEQLRANVLLKLAATLATARDAAEQIASSAAEATAKTILAMLSGAMPQFCAEHGPAEVQAIVAHLLPTLRSEPRVLVRVHPDLAAKLQRELDDRRDEFSGALTVLPTAAEPGDVKIEWENGALSRDTRRILKAMQDALGQLGLQQVPEITPKRRMANAE